ncbi:hypothetical protein KA405_04595 [Patescibacteria group bacterium]|nr:hypothetical protein [Patescibacteria group bacterium]
MNISFGRNIRRAEMKEIEGNERNRKKKYLQSSLLLLYFLSISSLLLLYFSTSSPHFLRFPLISFI